MWNEYQDLTQEERFHRVAKLLARWVIRIRNEQEKAQTAPNVKLLPAPEDSDNIDGNKPEKAT